MATKEVKFSSSDLTKLRELTGAGMMDCKNALLEAGGDLKGAQDVIRKKGLDIAKKKPLPQGRNEADQEESGPDVVQYHRQSLRSEFHGLKLCNMNRTPPMAKLPHHVHI